MGDLKKNLLSNFRRFTDGKNKVEYIAKLAMFTALSFVLYAFCKFPLPFMFPSFLEIQISEIPALIAGFSMGPISGCLVIVLKCLLKFPLSSTMFVGEITDIVLGICFVLPSSIIYNCKKSKKTAVIGLFVSSCFVTIMGVILNRFVSLPFYINVMFNGSAEPLLNMMKSLYKDITMDNFYAFYLFAGIMPFNIVRCIIVSIVTFILYPRLKRPLKLELSMEYEKKKPFEDIENLDTCGNKDNEVINNSSEDIAKYDKK